jgi:transketolase
MMKVKMEPTRLGYGLALERRGDDPRVVCLGADISGSITISKFYEKHPERAPRGKELSRFISVGIAEQNATTVAAGLAKEGKIPTFGTYGVFAAGRNLDQIRTTVAYGNFNVSSPAPTAASASVPTAPPTRPSRTSSTSPGSPG